MPKQYAFQCDQCKKQFTKWAGQCDQCLSWNSLVEYVAPVTRALSAKKIAIDHEQTDLPQILSLKAALEEHGGEHERMNTGSEECDRVFGQGMVRGSLNLLSGEPGIGKSTLLLFLSSYLADHGEKVLYVSGEESPFQVAKRAERLGLDAEHLELAYEHCIEKILAMVMRDGPSVLIVDSIQVLYSEAMTGSAGSMGQVRFVTELLMEFAKAKRLTVILIGHVTKDGTLAGPKVLEHLVDTVLVLEGERNGTLRFLRTDKNRFGPTDEVGVFSMEETGLKDVRNPSERFTMGRRKDATGSALTVTLEGTRAFLLEIQALTSTTRFGYPKRTSVGYDLNKLQLLLAVLSRYTKVRFDMSDVYLNIVGGLKIRDTGADVAVALALLSSKLGVVIPQGVVATGEIGLTGEIRSIAHLEKRIQESQRLGMKLLICPPREKKDQKQQEDGVYEVKTVEELRRLVETWK